MSYPREWQRSIQFYSLHGRFSLFDLSGTCFEPRHHSNTEENASGAGGAVAISLAQVDSLAVGLALQENVPVAITTELDQISAKLKAQVDGDLG